MKKQTKEKLKKSILTTLHVIGYICIGLTLITGIAIGVNSCKPKTEVQSYDHSSLELREKRVYNNNELSKLSNYNTTDQAINVKAKSVYLFNGNVSYDYSSLNIKPAYINSSGQAVFGGYGVYLVNFTSNTVDYYQGTYISVYSNRFNIGSPSRYTTTFFDSADKILLVFEDTRYWYADTDAGTDNYIASRSFFNDILVYVDDTISTQDYGNEYLSLNYSYYKNQVTNNWIQGGQTYLYPFVLPEYLKSYPVTAPVYTINSSNNIMNYYSQLQLKYLGNWLRGYFGDGSLDCGIFEVVSSGYSLYLGYTNYSEVSDGLCGYYFGTYAGCYKQSDTYRYFLGYSYLYNDVYANYGLKYVEGSLNISFNAYNLYNILVSGNNATLFTGGYLIYNGNAYSGVQVQFSPNLDGNSWRVFYNNDLGYTQVDFANDPLVSAQFIRYNHFQMKRAIEHFYNNSSFTKLNAPYIYDNPYSDIDVGGGSVESSGLGSAMDLIGRAFSSISDILNLQIFGAFTLGTLVFVPLVVTIILFVIKMFKR